MANMRMLIRIVFVIFIANGIDCLGGVCDNCCDCFKEKKEDKKEERKEYEEIEDDKNNIAESLVNFFWFDYKKKYIENNLVLKIFKKKNDNTFPSKDNGDKILIKSEEKGNPKIVYKNLEGEKYAFFEIKTNTNKTVYLYCSDIESSENNNGIFNGTTHVRISVIACDTTNVTNMEDMFFNCNSLTKLDLKNFNTTNVTNMQSMFSNCSSLTKLDLNNFDTSKVTNMAYMFSKCSNLEELDISNFNTSNVEDMGSMFCKCSRLKKLDLTNFNTTKVTNLWYMFDKCSKLPDEIKNKFSNKNK